MNEDNIKGVGQKIWGRIEEAAGTLVGDENLKIDGQGNQIQGSAREAWGNVKDAAGNLVDQARAAKYDAEAKTEAAKAFEQEHAVEITHDESK